MDTLKPLTNAEEDYGFSEGFLREWLKNAPKQVVDHLDTLIAGISAYREKYLTAQEVNKDTQDRYNQLTVLSAQYLQQIQQQKQQIDQLLVESQKDFHQGKYIET